VYNCAPRTPGAIRLRTEVAAIASRIERGDITSIADRHEVASVNAWQRQATGRAFQTTFVKASRNHAGSAHRGSGIGLHRPQEHPCRASLKIRVASGFLAVQPDRDTRTCADRVRRLLNGRGTRPTLRRGQPSRLDHPNTARILRSPAAIAPPSPTTPRGNPVVLPATPAVLQKTNRSPRTIDSQVKDQNFIDRRNMSASRLVVLGISTQIPQRVIQTRYSLTGVLQTGARGPPFAQGLERAVVISVPVTLEGFRYGSHGTHCSLAIIN